MEKECRQVVSDVSITSSKFYNDFLYGWLALNAHIEEGVGYIWKRDFVLSNMESEFGMTRKTLSKYFGYLIDSGLVEDKEDRFELVPLDEKGFWIEEDILKRLVETKKRYAISVYVFLKKGRWLVGKDGKDKVPIMLGMVKNYIGITNNSKGNNYVVVELFEEFRVLGLLKYELVKGREGNRQFYVLSGVGEDYYF